MRKRKKKERERKNEEEKRREKKRGETWTEGISNPLLPTSVVTKIFAFADLKLKKK